MKVSNRDLILYYFGKKKGQNIIVTHGNETHGNSPRKAIPKEG